MVKLPRNYPTVKSCSARLLKRRNIRNRNTHGKVRQALSRYYPGLDYPWRKLCVWLHPLSLARTTSWAPSPWTSPSSPGVPELPNCAAWICSGSAHWILNTTNYTLKINSQEKNSKYNLLNFYRFSSHHRPHLKSRSQFSVKCTSQKLFLLLK